MATVFVVDDERSITETVRLSLEKEGYNVMDFSNGEDAWNAFRTSPPDIIILDIMMPRMNGLELCRNIRSINSIVPIIFLSSRDEELDRIIGLEMGGDDYLCKPFSLKELLIRVKIILKRVFRSPEETPADTCIIQRGELKLDKNRGRCFWKEDEVILTLTEHRILESLIADPDIIRSREQLMQAAFPEDIYANARAVDSHIKRLRKKFYSLDTDFDQIETVYGMGYRYRIPV